MYQQFFQFRRLPFQSTPDPHFFFFTTRHEEAFNQALYAVKERKGFMVLTGEVGTGKTTLSRLLIEQLGPRVKTALVFNPNLTTVELLQSINHDFGVNDQSYSKKILTDELNQCLLEQLMQGGNAVLIIDEAQTLSVECLEEIRLLSNLETPRAKLLQILLIGQPELLGKLELPQLRQLNQRIVVRAHLTPLEPQEVADYIQYRLWRAGGREAVHFEPAALELVYRYSGGVPRLVNALCDRALLAAYVRGTRLISGYLMSQAVGELTPILPVTEPPPAYLTQEQPIPPMRSRPDPTLRVAVIGLVLLLSGLGMMWWNASPIEQRFPTALLAHEQSDAVQPPPLPVPPVSPVPPMSPLMDLFPSPEPLTGAVPMRPEVPEVKDVRTPQPSPQHPALSPPEPSRDASLRVPELLPSPAVVIPSSPTSAPERSPERSIERSPPTPLMAKIRIPLLPTEVVTPSPSSTEPATVAAPRAPATEPPKALTAPAASLPPVVDYSVVDVPVVDAPVVDAPIVDAKDALLLELRTDHVQTAMAQTDPRAATGAVDGHGGHGTAVFTLRAESMPTTATAPAGAVSTMPERAWFVDDDDVIHVGRTGTPELMERAALLMLLRQWGAVPDWPPKEPGGVLSLDPEALARERRLELLQVPLSGHDLLKLDYPAIVMRKDGAPGRPPHPVVISRMIGGRVLLLDPGAGFVSRPADTIDQELTGMVRLYWRPLNGWRWPGPIDGEDPVIRWLQGQLREQHIYHGRLDGLVGPETEEALRQLAGRRGLTVAPTDPLLDVFISQLLAPSDFPHLSLPDSGLSDGPGRTGGGPVRAAGPSAG